MVMKDNSERMKAERVKIKEVERGTTTVSKVRFSLFVFLLLCASIGFTYGKDSALAQETGLQVLVFSKTAGFRHGSIPAGITLIESAGEARDWTVVATEDGADFNDQNLAQYDVIVWLSTSGNVLDDPQQAAFERYIQSGGGYVGIHAASDTEYDWPWYGGLVGAYFSNHPQQQNADLIREDNIHPSTSFMPDRWTVFDEWYNFDRNPRSESGVTVLLTLDEASYSGGQMGADHPIAWYHLYDGGRAWYTAAGHRTELYTESAYADFQRHIIEGIIWAAGEAPSATETPSPQPTNSSIMTRTPTITPSPSLTPVLETPQPTVDPNLLDKKLFLPCIRK